MSAKRYAGLCIVFLTTFIPSSLYGDGCFFTDNYSADVFAPDQKVVITWDGKLQTMVLSTKVQSKELANFGWIIPVQSTAKPNVELGDVQIFYDLSDYFKTKVPGPILLGGIGGANSGFDSIEVLETKELGIYDIVILQATDEKQLYKWLKINNFKIPRHAKKILSHYTKKDFYFITVKIDLMNKFRADIEVIEKFKLMDLVEYASSQTPIVDHSFPMNVTDVELIMFNALLNKPYTREIDEYITSQDYEKINKRYSLNEPTFKKVNEPLSRVAKMLFNLNQGVSKPLKITFSPKTPFFPLKISSINTGNSNVTAYIIANDPLKDKNRILEPSEFKEMGKSIRAKLNQYLNPVDLTYITKLSYFGESKNFREDVYFTKMDYSEKTKYFKIYEGMFEAANTGDLEYTKKYLKKVPDINKKFGYYTLLSNAIRHKQKYIVEYLIDNGALIVQGPKVDKTNNLISTSRDMDGPSSLYHAIDSGDADIIELLINKGADIERIGKNWLYAINRNMSVEIIQVLISHGLDIDAADSFNSTLLHKAAGANNLEIVKFLIEQGAGIEKRDHIGETPLISAAHPRNSLDGMEIVKFLIDAGAKINAKTKFDDTALVFAAKRGNINTVKLLLAEGYSEGNNAQEEGKVFVNRDELIKVVDSLFKNSMSPRMPNNHLKENTPSRYTDEYKKAVVDYKAELINVAEEILEKLPGPDPSLSNIFLKRGDHFFQKKQYKEAIADFEKAISMDTQNPKPLNSLAWLYATGSDSAYLKPSLALEYAQKSVKISATSRHLNTLAVAYAANGRFKEAIEAQQQAIEKTTSPTYKKQCSQQIEGYRKKQTYIQQLNTKK